VATIHRHLRAGGQVDPRPPQTAPLVLHPVCRQPNERGQADSTRWRLSDRIHVITESPWDSGTLGPVGSHRKTSDERNLVVQFGGVACGSGK
jgi:hypothetical protein